MDENKNRQAALKLLDFMAENTDLDNLNLYDILHIFKIAEELVKEAFKVRTFKEATQNCIRMANEIQPQDDSDRS